MRISSTQIAAQQRNDAVFMRQAISLAWEGTGFVSPNPLVGAVIVKDGQVLAAACHQKYGAEHAEVRAIAAAGANARGATLYCTLEPCCHQGQQPPCTEAIKKSGITRVVIGSRDPNPLVSGKGQAELAAAGIAVTADFLRGECDKLNPIFFHYITTGLPYVALKYAMSLDGKIATCRGDSQWITGAEARSYGHRLRHKYKAVLIGRGTAQADDPLLTARFSGANQPVRIVLDSQLRISPQAKLVETAGEIPTIIATDFLLPFAEKSAASLSKVAQGASAVQSTSTNQAARAEKAQLLEAKGVQILQTELVDGQIAIAPLLKKLAAQKIDSVFVEGGGRVHWSFIESGLVNKVYAFIAPVIIGGAAALTPVEGAGFPILAESWKLQNLESRKLGKDLLLTGEIPSSAAGAPAAENAADSLFFLNSSVTSNNEEKRP
ncbi:bifunctional diaminohydroxyphosphoribosylaminopyrimidine deaminase/5-amino-6-(5-phosphoribosylamino)uracil reductase RibD [Arcanobacterium urinimassiliense]|uniref:bifunctional diaminohydroxyphosphoribosylaminopyrimidine deaminase/5-amino-6-(5-phosphoribosylamino)uracil reductase RibD n=1 Tax=Arcanobacterium urinimassiliense TaxID=1871014 RepID=UPI00093AFC4A|nr:bifunctional diaminohydroxyphosphoribosylaminopyrimidine deaminase/5-amino-6-(5-phosphoribosylamino)uracil reductase RibD [Arcanobacterium urinimassiliense]